MPTKPNRAGQQQPYVPAGNSNGGEYGDTATGSNKNYFSDAFKMGLERGFAGQSLPPSVIKTSSAGVEEQAIVNAEISAHYKRILRSHFQAGTKEGQAILDKMQSERRTSFTYVTNSNGQDYCNWYLRIVTFSKGYNFGDLDFQSGGYTKNPTSFWHENGHAVDLHGYWSTQWEDPTTRKTLAETLWSECDEGGEELIGRIKADYQKEKALFGKTAEGFMTEEEKKLADGIKIANDKVWDEFRPKQDELARKYGGGHNAGDLQATRYMIDNNTYEEYMKEKSELYRSIQAKYGITDKLLNERTAIFNKARDRQRAFDLVWADVSDVVDGMTHKRTNINGFGHNSSYWLGSKGLNNRAYEFFAEAFSGKCYNSESYKRMKKYFPKTCAVFENAYNEILNGEAKWK